jgi:hypothetical protein
MSTSNLEEQGVVFCFARPEDKALEFCRTSVIRQTNLETTHSQRMPE